MVSPDSRLGTVGIYIQYIYIYNKNCGVSFWTCSREISGKRNTLKLKFNKKEKLIWKSQTPASAIWPQIRTVLNIETWSWSARIYMYIIHITEWFGVDPWSIDWYLTCMLYTLQNGVGSTHDLLPDQDSMDLVEVTQLLDVLAQRKQQLEIVSQQQIHAHLSSPIYCKQTQYISLPI